MPDSQVLTSDSAKALEVIFGKPEDGVMVGGSKREKQRRAKYWRKPDHEGATDAGWIIVGPDYMTDAARHDRMKNLKGWKELPDSFGLEITGQPNSIITWEGRKDQGKNPERWLEPFFKAGGLTYIIQPGDGYGKPGDYLIPAMQLVTYGFHRRKGITDLRPDLASAVDLECEHGCINENNTRKLFSGITLAHAQKSLDQHMTSHKQSEGSRSAGREIQKVIEAMEAKGQKMDAEDIAKIVAATIVALQQAQVVEVSQIAAKKYPEGTPDETWKRPQLMAYAADSGMKQLSEPMRKTQAQWLEYVLSQESAE
jgi:hypothetical protein